MQDALEMRIAHADLVHVVDGVLDVVDAVAALADALRHQARPAVQVELAHEGRMRRVGEEREGHHRAAPRGAYRHQARLVYAARHLAVPQVPEHPAHAPRLDAEGHAPARAAAAQADDQPRPEFGAAIAGGKNAERAVVAVHAADAPFLVAEPGRPHQRAVAEDPEVAARELRHEILKLHLATPL